MRVEGWGSSRLISGINAGRSRAEHETYGTVNVFQGTQYSFDENFFKVFCIFKVPRSTRKFFFPSILKKQRFWTREMS